MQSHFIGSDWENFFWGAFRGSRRCVRDRLYVIFHLVLVSQRYMSAVLGNGTRPAGCFSVGGVVVRGGKRTFVKKITPPGSAAEG